MVIAFATLSGCYPWVSPSQFLADNPPPDLSGNCLDEDALDWFLDADGDGLGDAAHSKRACVQPADHVAESGDCDDASADRFPGNPEIPYDGVDQDCSGEDLCDIDGDGLLSFAGCGGQDCDDQNGLVGELVYYTDGDGDDYGAPATGQLCQAAATDVLNDDDCDDTSDLIYPGAPDPVGDTVDSNCDGIDGVDADGDGFIPIGLGGTDCDDSDATFHPDAPDFVDNGFDNNCDGVPGEDADGDGVASEASNGTDCRDDNANIYPGADEWCDQVDGDCDGTIDGPNPQGATVFSEDFDGDGYGNALVSAAFCEVPAGFVANDTDCNDANNLVYPGAADVADGVDHNCDGVPGVDADGDTWASTLSGGADCADGDPNIHPGAVEVPYDLVDQDCAGGDLCDVDQDGLDAEHPNCGGLDCDDDDGAVGNDFYYADADVDGFGAAGAPGNRCAPVDVSDVANDADCEDTDATINPGEPDLVANGFDNNCDGVPGVDADGDGWASLASGGSDCDDTDTNVYAGAPDFTWNAVDNDCDGLPGVDSDGDGQASSGSGGADCDDDDDTQYTGAIEVCNGEDDDCEGTPDYPSPVGAQAWYADTDGDDFGDGAAVTEACLAPVDFVAVDGDCDDTNGLVNPLAVDLVDGTDHNCDGVPGVDADGDFSASLASGGLDCDDANAGLHPGASETPYDGVDQDCDGSDWCDVDGDGFPHPLCGGSDCDDTSVLADDTWYFVDADGDGYGDNQDPGVCASSGSDATNNLDCDDSDGAYGPGAPDGVADGLDQNCDGVAGVDADGDGFASLTSGGDDCNDTSGLFFPGAPDTVGDLFDESCDGIDGVDNDQDGFASTASGGLDCADDNVLKHPAGIDNLFNDMSCDGTAQDVGTANARFHSVFGDYDSASDVRGGDFNGDGFGDVMVLGSQSNPGGVHFFYGSPEGLENLPLDFADSYLFQDVLYDPPTVIQSGGDLNNDGFDDLVIADFEIVYLIRGGPDRFANVSYLNGIGLGTLSGDFLMFEPSELKVSISGDFNGDNNDDVIVGSRFRTGPTGGLDGAVHLVLGPLTGNGGVIDPIESAETARVTGELDSQAGAAVDLVDDLNGDGYADMLIGAPYDSAGGVEAGAAYVVFGSATPADVSLDLADIKWTAAPGEHAGGRVIDAGDVNGDGLSDIAISTLSQIFLFYGHTGAWTSGPLSSADVVLDGWVDDQWTDWSIMGTPISSIGDLDADGYDDLAVYANGQVHLIMGSAVGIPSGTLSQAAAVVLQSTGDPNRFGVGLGSAGDTNGDGYDDLLCGDPDYDDRTGADGAAFLFHGSAR